MWIFIVVAIVVAVILCAIFVKSDLEKTEWAEEIGRDGIFGTRIDRNWIFPPEDPMHYETCDEHKYDEVTLMLHFKDGTQKRIRVKDKGEPYDEYHLYLPKIIGNLCDGEEFSSLNAVSDARDYLDSGAFSHKGLTEQLVSDGYPPEQAEYGAENCGADWNFQAVKAAKEYLDAEAFSHESLKKQLAEEEYFTTGQAEHGAGNCGADWNFQAVKAAKEYLDAEAFSYESLKKQLAEEEYFTPGQAEYGADNCGADWKEQAARYAKKYFDPEENSKEELTEILSDEGFTEDEINYAISKTEL